MIHKKTFLIIVGIVILVSGFLYFTQKAIAPIPDYRTIPYTIDNQPVNFGMTTIHYFGNEVHADFNNDGTEDVAFILTEEGDGSGTFYYLVAALKGTSSYTSTNSIFLGDRIAPQTTEFRDGTIIVNYADRKNTDPMTTPPSIGVSRYFKISDGKLIEFDLH